MKRKYSTLIEDEKDNLSIINDEFIYDCERNFKSDHINEIVRNTVTALGSQLSSMNSNRINKLNYLFLNSIKKKHLKATDQGRTGRCWLFAGLNTFRHTLIRALDLDDFEFSEVYLFFWDKFERSNTYLQYFIDNPKLKYEDRYFDYIVEHFMSDGGYWNFFTNLVEKYGLIPKSAMKETFQSEDSDDMNQIIEERLNSCVSNLMDVELTKEYKIQLKRKTLKNIYNILVKFLGEPPKKFDWTFSIDDTEDYIRTIPKLNPFSFKDMIMPTIKTCDFIVLSHIPSKPLNTLYEINHTSNVYEGENVVMYNTDIEELSKYTMKSIVGGIGVWVGLDMRQKFNPYHSMLDDQLDDSELMFGKNVKFDKTQQIIFRNTQANHAMLFTGFNTDDKGKPVEYSLENSWGFLDHNTEGLDGWLNMSHSWFKKYVIEVVILKRFLSRSLKNKIMSQKIVKLDPFDSFASSLRIKGLNAPLNYLEKMRIGKNMRK